MLFLEKKKSFNSTVPVGSAFESSGQVRYVHVCMYTHKFKDRELESTHYKVQLQAVCATKKKGGVPALLLL